MKQYLPIHIHTDFSIGDSILNIDDYINWAKENEFKSICISDHGNICAAMYFNQKCIEKGIKPIIGIEAYGMYEKEFKTDVKRQHMILIAKNEKGYKDLLKILGKSMRESFYYRPIVFYEDLYKYAGNIIVTTACLAGRVQQAVINGNEHEATRFALEMQSVFKDDFYFECVENGIKEQRHANDWMFENSKRLGIKVIFTTDSHYLKSEHVIVHDVLKLNLQKLSFLDENFKEKIYSSRNLYLKTREQILDEVKQEGYDVDSVEKALDTTFEINDKCEQYSLKSKEVYMPKFSDNSYKELYERAKKALIDKKLSNTIYVERLKHELKVIRAKKMEDYFLIVADIIDFANKNNIMVGVGRGSGGGSLVVYLLGITKIDPIKYDLLFERMLNMQRTDPPDIDLDFDSRGRPKIEEYLKEKYGIKSVSHIISFGRFGIKGALRDTFRTFYRMEYKVELNKCLSYISDIEEDFDNAIDVAKKLGGKDVIEFLGKHADKVEIARVLVGKNRHYSLHAGGVVISNGDLENYIPIMRIDDNIVAGLQEGADNRLITDAGLMKFDILGLNACSILSDAFELLKGKVTIEDIINDDSNEKVLEQFQKCNTFGVFQFEGKKITEFVREVFPQKFEDLVAINALYRPAVIIAGGLDKYIKNKIRFDDNTTDPFEMILNNTYGVPVYQEQIMQIFHKLGGLTLEEADEARHILKLLFKGKEDYTDFNKLMSKFKEGCHKTTNYSDEKIEEIMNTVKQFSSYSFNRSHSCAYAMMGYVMQYLKVFYPVEYFSALLTNTDNSDTRQDKIEVNLLRDYTLHIHNNTEVKIVKPDVNTSDAVNYRIDGKKLLFPLSQIKGVGINGALEIVSKAPFKSFNDFINKIEKRKVNKRVVKALMKADALKFEDSDSGYEKQYKEKIQGCKIRNSFEVLNIIFDNEFKALFPDYYICLKDVKNNKARGTKVYAFIYKLRPIITKNNRRLNFVSLYDGTAILDNCKTQSIIGLEENTIIKCTLDMEKAWNEAYTKDIYILKNIEEIKYEKEVC